MPPRNTLLALFSTFADLQDDRIRCWISDARLQRNMIRHLAQTPTEKGPEDRTRSEKIWVHYWIRQWRDGHPEAQSKTRSSLSQQHLSAYLQESFYWTAQKITQRFPGTSQSTSDLFQSASLELPRLLQGYNSDLGSSLKSYAAMVLFNNLKDQLRQRREIDICSQWSLLRKVSKRCVRETLLSVGINDRLGNNYFQAWICFNICYIPASAQGTERLAPPDCNGWQRITDEYNQNYQDEPAITPQEIEARLLKLTTWIRSRFYPNVGSLNQTRAGYESGEIQDDLVDDEPVTLLDRAIEQEAIQERTAQHLALKCILEQALSQLDPEAQVLLQLFYQEHLSQSTIAQHLGVNQSQISRRLQKAEAQLLQRLLDWIRQQTHEFLKPAELKPISDRLKEWLIDRYQV